MPRDINSTGIVAEMDKLLDSFMDNTRYFHEPFNLGRAYTFVLQHRQKYLGKDRSWQEEHSQNPLRETLS